MADVPGMGLDTNSQTPQYWTRDTASLASGVPSQGGLFPMVANPIVPAPEFQFDIEKTQTETIFHCAGRITSSTSSQLKSAVRSAIPEKKPIVLDLSKVTYMDSSGLGALVGVWVSAKRDGCELKLASLGERVKELLRLTGLEKVLAVSRFPDTPSF